MTGNADKVRTTEQLDDQGRLRCSPGPDHFGTRRWYLVPRTLVLTLAVPL